MNNMDKGQTALKILVTDTYNNLNKFSGQNHCRPFKPVEGRNGPTTFFAFKYDKKACELKSSADQFLKQYTGRKHG